MANKPTDHHREIHKSWHRLGIYLRKEWLFLVRKVHLGKITSFEAENIMHSDFGVNQAIWNLHGVLQVPPVPPRPP